VTRRVTICRLRTLAGDRLYLYNGEEPLMGMISSECI
jgi:hypothetical protein